MNERIGVLSAILSSTLGETVAATTRFVVADPDPLDCRASECIADAGREHHGDASDCGFHPRGDHDG